MDGLRDRSRRPRTSPDAPRAEVADKIVHLRRNYHFGPGKIAIYLQRYHDVTISVATVWRILHRLDMDHLPASQRVSAARPTLEALRETTPGASGADRREVRRTTPEGRQDRRATRAGRAAREVLPVHRIDDCTRLRVLKIYPKLNQKTAIQFFDYVLSQLPFAVEKIQTDNGTEFGTQFHWHVLDKGIGHVYIKPRTPRLNGKSSVRTASTSKSSTGYSTVSSSTM